MCGAGCADGGHKVYNKFCLHECERNIGEAMNQEEKLCTCVEAVREFTYQVTKVSVEDVRLM